MPDWLSLLPATIAIAYVLWRKDVIVALLLAIVCSELLLALSGSASLVVVDGVINTGKRVLAVFGDPGNARIIAFSLLIGVVLAFMRFSGGVSATVHKLVNSGIASNARKSGLVTFFTGVVIFIESNLSVLTAGILSRGLFDKFGMSRERLAYIIDSTSAPICILILLNGWGAFVLGIIAPYEMEQSAVSILLGTVPLNIYALSTLAVVFYTVWTGKVYGPLAKTEVNQSSDKSAELQEPGRAIDMILPLVVIVFGMLGCMLWTGGGDIMTGSGSKSVLYATVAAMLVSYVLLTSQGKFSQATLFREGVIGIKEIFPLVMILLLSIALGASVKQLGTGVFISGLVADYLPLFLVPAVVFIAGAFASFTTGTSWGTFALLVPIAMPIAINLGLPPSLVLAAVLGGGVFGDHCSPVSDTTAVSSLAAGCDILDHVKTQLPYALFCGAITIVAYILMGLAAV
jgi:Na+/H+ antiporter NhaC